MGTLPTVATLVHHRDTVPGCTPYLSAAARTPYQRAHNAASLRTRGRCGLFEYAICSHTNPLGVAKVLRHYAGLDKEQLLLRGARLELRSSKSYSGLGFVS
jgi:hypothetical protein